MGHYQDLCVDCLSNKIRQELSGPAHGIVLKSVHKTLPMLRHIT